MWDPDQLAEIPVIADRLQAEGDLLGEWLAIRMRLDRGGVARPERKTLRRRARALRDRLGPRVILAQDSRLGRPYVVRDHGQIADLSVGQATPERLGLLLDRPDAAFVLRLRLRGEIEALRGCVELLLAPGSSPGRSLRELGLELVDAGDEPDLGAGRALGAELRERAQGLGEGLPSLFGLDIDGVSLALPFDRVAVGSDQPWTARRRTALGRALASPEPADRLGALERLLDHGEDAGQLRAPLLAIIERDPEPRVRAAAFAVVPRLGEVAEAIMALSADAARERDDPQLRDWLKLARGP
ncbi:hypothetical protein ENSA5_01720 [Enhygromyxa salina]|uniref:HEAT repeat protein n=1 Tax=Enhygromyxa salina TaxID=215803 RepID=A0A2S9YLD6_9BACT|nr:hypothetical protein [Enhygromyxa salina]PRQ05852.1 hypothetical protein ENSA5_01720 [Enhygromyxa salina]